MSAIITSYIYLVSYLRKITQLWEFHQNTTQFRNHFLHLRFVKTGKYIILCNILQVCLMSQSWDNVASMHDHVFITVHAHKHSLLVPCACTDGSGCRGHTPPTKCAMATFSLCSRRAASNVVTGLLTGMTKNRPCLSLRSRLCG